MPTPRNIFIVLAVLVPLVMIAGIVVLTVMEQQARAALPPGEQTAEAIASIYDGAVCLGCDYGRVFFAMFGSASFVAVLLGWAVYEAGRVALVKMATPK